MFCMNIAYLYLGRLSVGSGVHKKILMQIKQWERQGHTVKIYHASTDHINTFKDYSVDTTFEYISNIGLFIQKHQEPFKLGSWCFYCLHIVCN